MQLMKAKNEIHCKQKLFDKDRLHNLKSFQKNEKIRAFALIFSFLKIPYHSRHFHSLKNDLPD